MPATTAPQAPAAAGNLPPPAAEPAGQAAFNPFGTAGIVVATPPLPAAPELPGGDPWLPLAASLAGFALLAWMMRRMLD